ncbi:MAG: aminotransferase class I/II-fold pyridoxal phosphate-dependent enzyme [Bacteroidetes bacterium]|nr:aminotransferase class I/II-fold pyridoxal phosphate-dependent enzyme [Bacteroidota bacterium]
MIIPAQRVNAITEYYFSKKLREISKHNELGEDIINLGIGNPDMPPSDSTLNTLQSEITKHDAHGYQPYKGIAGLRSAFANWYQRSYEVELDPEREILPLIGSKEGILHISLTFLNPGDQVLIPDPGYPTYQSVTKMLGAEPITYSLVSKLGWQPELEKLNKLDLSKVKLMWINYPNMPTGAKADMAFFKRVIDFGKKNNIIICNDNPYSFILNEKPLSILSVKGAKEIAIELNSLSKSHNMAGWRIGMLASNPEVINFILKIKSNTDSGIFKPLQLAAISALNSSKEWYTNLNYEYRKRREIVLEILDILLCKYTPDQNGMFIWAKIPESFKNSEAFSEHILNTYKVFITPGFIFGSQGDKYIRISLCINTSKLNIVKSRIQLINKK